MSTSTNEYREQVLERARQKWAKTGNWKMRQRIGTSVERMRLEIETVSESEKYDPWQVAESLLEIQDEIKTFLSELSAVTKP